MRIALAGYSRRAYVNTMTSTPPLPSNVQEMIDDFAYLDDWEDRYMHVIEMGRALAPMALIDKNPQTKVKGCVSQVWLRVDLETGPDGAVRLNYQGDSDAHIVKGLVAIVLQMVSGRTAREITALNAPDIIARLGLSEHLSPQRSNGLSAMIARIERDTAGVEQGL